MQIPYLARSLNVDPPRSTPGYGLLFGGETAMDTRDGDASYAEVSANGGDPAVYNEVTFRLEREAGYPAPTPGAVPTGLVIEAELKETAGTNGAISIGIVFPYEGSTLALAVSPAMFAGTTYETVTSTSTSGPASIMWEHLLGADSYFTMTALDPGLTEASLMRVTYLRLWVTVDAAAAPLPLRQRQRGDGLGLSVGRWRNRGSRQSSNRWAGYL